ncbi:MAG: hypothetical protein ACKV1O_17050 [Saprospiraceae bacterium]
MAKFVQHQWEGKKQKCHPSTEFRLASATLSSQLNYQFTPYPSTSSGTIRAK